MNHIFTELREKYLTFTYHSYEATTQRQELQLAFSFSTGEHRFTPTVVIPQISVERWQRLPEELKSNLIFHLGLIEMISYWKATCSPVIVLEAGILNEEQQAWWKDLIWDGLGEFLYRNEIEIDQDELVRFENKSTTSLAAVPLELQQKIAIPIGGGKDSVVTLESLKKTSQPLWLWALNPIPATERIAHANPNLLFIGVKRTLDPHLLELNQQGYLNGHTPFSAYIAFLSVLMSVLFDSHYTAVSNEFSANEGNLNWQGRDINHQYSKSFTFEKKFREYSQLFLTPNPEYFSYLRPLHELQIGSLFAKYPHYFEAFRSCNVGQKTDSWCHKCAKCLFAFAMIAPFVPLDTVTQKIFHSNLLEDADMIKVADALINPDLSKPWDCVGTREESAVAFALLIQKYQDENKELPVVLSSLLPKMGDLTELISQSSLVASDWNEEHFIPSNFASFLKSEVIKK